LPATAGGGLRWNWMSGEYLRDEITTQRMVTLRVRLEADHRPPRARSTAAARAACSTRIAAALRSAAASSA